MINGNACFADFNKNWGISVHALSFANNALGRIVTPTPT
jgi:hypothetical protein